MPRPYPDSAERENFRGGWDFQKAHPLGEHLLKIAVTQSEPGVQPDRMADDIGWEAVTFKGELAHRASLMAVSRESEPAGTTP